MFVLCLINLVIIYITNKAHQNCLADCKLCGFDCNNNSYFIGLIVIMIIFFISSYLIDELLMIIVNFMGLINTVWLTIGFVGLIVIIIHIL